MAEPAKDPVSEFLEKHKLNDIHAKDKHGNSALMIALSENNEPIALAIIERAPEQAHELDKAGYAPVYLAASNNLLNVMKKLIEAKADINYMPPRGYSSIYIATLCGLTDMVKLLIENQASPAQANVYGGSLPFCAAVAKKHVEIFTMLYNNNVRTCNHEEAHMQSNNLKELRKTIDVGSGIQKAHEAKKNEEKENK